MELRSSPSQIVQRDRKKSAARGEEIRRAQTARAALQRTAPARAALRLAMSKFAKDGNSFRREWDKEAFEKRAKERLEHETELEEEREREAL